ncbi:putative aspartate aminotransferase [Trypanosoma theileri]|uniref:Putative aspartate aminotransferase n=1 Tax=Trypanosoma theileri TaxID=67003 RepID=A0A1X0NIT8_9TRYP|nr:putative aspartate aminotransferase [Trypanosoma theileri]ORC84662.1 putative aspartate aminotransferase [Trypanosoma theileri]
MASTSFWENVPSVPPDAIFALSLEAKKAPEPKADLIVGAYRDADGRPYPLKVVEKAEHRLVTEICPNKEYLPMKGFAPFIEEALKLAYGDCVPRSRIAAAQGLSGTGSLSMGAHLIAKVLSRETPVYISDPTWPNHYAVMEAAGLSNTRKYRYYNPATRSLDFEGLIADISNAPERSVIILHACAHNPTGVDPTKEQWAKIAEVVKQRNLIAFFDCAYQGYATGSLDNDAYAIRLFVREGLEIMLAQSFSKNMGLYSERVGVCSLVLAKEEKAPALEAQLESIARAMYSTPPAHGARLAHLVMSNPELRREWEEELQLMANRVQEMRQAVFDGLKKRGTPGTWDHVISQLGMFSYLGLTRAQCEKLIEKRVFVLPSGRANMAGLTTKTVELLVDAIDEVVRAEPSQ